MKNFVEKRVNSKTESFWDPVPNLKVKKVNVKAADDQVITAVNVDRDLFGRLLITANTRKINLKEVLRYELSPIPRALITFLLWTMNGPLYMKIEPQGSLPRRGLDTSSFGREFITVLLHTFKRNVLFQVVTNKILCI